jgi:transposase InsO family protein
MAVKTLDGYGRTRASRKYHFHSRRGNSYWVSFIDDHSRFPAVYFIAKKSGVFDAFRKYKAWSENLTGQKIGILRDDKGGEYVGGDFDKFLTDAGIRREHSIRDTPQQLGVAERLNRSISEGITTILSQSGLSRSWWEDAANICTNGITEHITEQCIRRTV